MDNSSTLNLTQGMDVVGSDGEKVGSVQDVQGEYVVVSKGFFFPTDYYIPFSALNNADGDNVYLNVTKDEALNQGWDQVPEATTTTTTAYDDQPITDAGLPIDNPVGGTAAGTGVMDTEDQPFDHHVDRGQVAHDDVRDNDTINVPLTEEELTAQTRGVERGQVQIDKVVSSEERTLDVPVTEEHVHVTRRTVDRDVNADDATFEEGTIDVPVYGEEVDLEKRARVREEVEISKDATTETERVSGTVRREDVRVTDDSDTVVSDVDDVNRPGRANG
ncbi:MAG: DUF2382 domain-containing protein [Chloroflexia bacterium]|nr:DUF2382 domain-containing protein [Chloroflexia bacterium]